MSLAYKTIASPVGTLTLVATNAGLAAVLWENDKPNRVRLAPAHPSNDHTILLKTEKQLAEYFAGTRTAFDLPLDMQGTSFQRSVWQALLAIPYGETLSYAQLAERLKNPKAMRAVGAANGRNPVSIIVPCHRVIGANGNLTGFAGGLATKEYLLKLERNSR